MAWSLAVGRLEYCWVSALTIAILITDARRFCGYHHEYVFGAVTLDEETVSHRVKRLPKEPGG
jgi:hypothetical protein